MKVIQVLKIKINKKLKTNKQSKAKLIFLVILKIQNMKKLNLQYMTILVYTFPKLSFNFLLLKISLKNQVFIKVRNKKIFQENKSLENYIKMVKRE